MHNNNHIINKLVTKYLISNQGISCKYFEYQRKGIHSRALQLTQMRANLEKFVFKLVLLGIEPGTPRSGTHRGHRIKTVKLYLSIISKLCLNKYEFVVFGSLKRAKPDLPSIELLQVSNCIFATGVGQRYVSFCLFFLNQQSFVTVINLVLYYKS